MTGPNTLSPRDSTLTWLDGLHPFALIQFPEAICFALVSKMKITSCIRRISHFYLGLGLFLYSSGSGAHAQTFGGPKLSTDFSNTSFSGLPLGVVEWHPGTTFFSGNVGPPGALATPNNGLYWLVQSGVGQPVGSYLGLLSPLTVVELGDIPALAPVHGKLAAFVVNSSKLGAGASFSFAFDPETPAPRGPVNLDSATGLFTYIPDTADLRAFSLLITASGGGQRIEQAVDVEPFPVIPPEESFLPTGHGLPDAESIHYQVSNAVTNEPIVFNDINRSTLDIIISGKSVPIRRKGNGMFRGW